jgi:glutaredoxin 2
MNVFDIITEQDPAAVTQGTTVATMSDLRNAFTDDQWRNIIMHFLKVELDRAASTEDREYQIDRANAAIGGKSNSLSPTSWASQALNYDIRLPKPPGSWQEIYDFIKPHANTKVQLKAAPQSKPLTTNREETLSSIATWVPVNVNEFTADLALKDYIKKWFEVLPKKRSEKWVEVYNTTKDNNNAARRARNSELDKLNQQFQKNGKILKKDVDIVLFSILRTIDTIISNVLQAKK